MSENFVLAVDKHPAFGALATLRLPAQPPRRFTFQEASILARALEAVASGASGEKLIYMSPIASDADFDARVETEGVSIAAPGAGPKLLSWAEALALAAALREVGQAS